MFVAQQEMVILSRRFLAIMLSPIWSCRSVYWKLFEVQLVLKSNYSNQGKTRYRWASFQYLSSYFLLPIPLWWLFRIYSIEYIYLPPHFLSLLTKWNKWKTIKWYINRALEKQVKSYKILRSTVDYNRELGIHTKQLSKHESWIT